VFLLDSAANDFVDPLLAGSGQNGNSAAREWKRLSLAEGRTCKSHRYGDLCFGVFALSVEIRPSAVGGTCVS
jgi:hypothetical protein